MRNCSKTTKHSTMMRSMNASIRTKFHCTYGNSIPIGKPMTSVVSIMTEPCLWTVHLIRIFAIMTVLNGLFTYQLLHKNQKINKKSTKNQQKVGEVPMEDCAFLFTPGLHDTVLVNLSI